MQSPASMLPAARIDWEKMIRDFPDALIVTGSDLTILFVNRAFIALAGLGEDLAGRKCHEVFSGALCQGGGCPLTRARHGRERQVFKNGHHCKAGRRLPWSVDTVALSDEQGRFAGILERIVDLSSLEALRTELGRNQEQVRKTMGAVIQAMSTTIELRDPYTAGHQRRVAKLCRAIATLLGFSWERIQGLRMAAAVHDLGKILVPAGILNKPGKMSEHEMAIIRLHPTTAYEILREIEFPWPLAETVYQHHERLDGSGYPRGLRGDQILLEARILAVADVVESMTSFRPYRPALGVESAVDELGRHKDRLYDPQIVDICIELLTAKGFDFKSKAWRQRA